MPSFTNELLENGSYSSRAVAFNRQLPIGGRIPAAPGNRGDIIPPGVEVNPDGSATVRFYAPNARSVKVKIRDQELELQKGEGGVWSGTVPYTTPGFKAFDYVVDGTVVMNPMAPIGFGSSKPTNYIEFPEEDGDFYLIKDVPHGTVAREFFFSTVTGRYESCMLYLPPQYFAGGEERYPVLYLQHGHGENEACWIYQGKVNFVMDNLIAEGKAVPFIIVMNNGMVQARGEDGEMRVVSSLLERLLIEDCIPFIEKKYRVYTDKAHRAMAGLSMGSMQTSATTMKHPELFEYAGIFSGFLRSLMDGGRGNEHLAAMDDPDFKSRFKVFMRCIGVSDVFIDTFKADGVYMAERGLDPEHWANHVEKLYPGEHEWQVWRKCMRDFAQLIFK